MCAGVCNVQRQSLVVGQNGLKFGSSNFKVYITLQLIFSRQITFNRLKVTSVNMASLNTWIDLCSVFPARFSSCDVCMGKSVFILPVALRDFFKRFLHAKFATRIEHTESPTNWIYVSLTIIWQHTGAGIVPQKQNCNQWGLLWIGNQLLVSQHGQVQNPVAAWD